MKAHTLAAPVAILSTLLTLAGCAGEAPAPSSDSADVITKAPSAEACEDAIGGEVTKRAAPRAGAQLTPDRERVYGSDASESELFVFRVLHVDADIYSQEDLLAIRSRVADGAVDAATCRVEVVSLGDVDYYAQEDTLGDAPLATGCVASIEAAVLAEARLSDPAQTVARTTRVYGHADDYRTGVVVTRLRDGSDYATVFEIGTDESACAARLTRKIGGRAAAPPPELGK